MRPLSHLLVVDQFVGETGERGKPRIVRGAMEGRIGHSIAGENGFGYDPFFYLPQYGKTSAEIAPEEKNRISHRGQALRKMMALLGLYEGEINS